MQIPETKHERPQIDKFVKEGFTSSYKMEDGKLKDLETEKLFSPKEVTIYDEYRYEGMSNPSDMSILYALKTKDGNKGTLLIPYGPTADIQLADFMMEVTKDMRNNRSIEEVENALKDK